MNAIVTALAARPASDIVLQGAEHTVNAGQLLQQTETLAQTLRDKKIHRVALYADNSPAWVAVDLACQLAGLTLIPLPTFFSRQQLEHQLQAAAVELLICQCDLVEQLPPLQCRRCEPVKLLDGIAMLSLADTEFRPQLPPGTHKITFTSGSTGEPKGVCLSTAQCLAVAQSLVEAVAIEHPHHLCLLPLSTLLENIAGVYMPLLAGGRITLLPAERRGLGGSSQLNAEQLLATLSDSQPNTLILVPELLTLLEQAIAQGWQPCASLAFIAVGGARVAPSLLARLRKQGLPVYEGYGLSECASVVALNTPASERVGSSGKLLAHLRAHCHNGELIIEGNSFLGYLNRPDSWGRHSVASGDLATLGDGFVTIQGRQKNVLISSFGRNISPEWLEGELLAENILQQAIVIGDARPHCAALLSTDAGDGDIDAALARVNRRLPDYARIHSWYRLPTALTREQGLLTDNGRPRRDRINEHFRAEIARLYLEQKADQLRVNQQRNPTAITAQELATDEFL